MFWIDLMCTRNYVNSFCYKEKYQVTESSFSKRTPTYANYCPAIPIRDRKNPSRSNSWGVLYVGPGFTQSRRYCGDSVVSSLSTRRSNELTSPQFGSSCYWVPLASPPLYISRGTTDIEFATALTHLQQRRITTRWATYARSHSASPKPDLPVYSTALFT